MEDLKIKIESDKEAREAIKLAELIGYKADTPLCYNWSEKNQYLCLCSDMSAGFLGPSGATANDKEITLPQLKDLVVLKRNDKADSNSFVEKQKGMSIYRNSEGELYFYSLSRMIWVHEDEAYPGRDFITFDFEDIKPIERTMKEYLTKMQDGSYELIPFKVDDNDIEIPEGANTYATASDGMSTFWSDEYQWMKNGEITRKASTDKSFSFSDWQKEWSAKILWQRETKPKKEPFGGVGIKTHQPSCLKESLNDQYMRIEKFKQSKIKSDGGSTNYYKKEIPKWMLEQFNQAGVIEAKDVIRLFLGNDFNKGNIFKAQVRINSLESGAGKEGISGEYDHNKIVFFAEDDRKAYLGSNK